MAATRFSVSAIFSVDNRFSAPVKKMAGDLKRFMVSATVGAKMMNNGINKLGGSIRRMVTGSVLGLGTLALALTDVIRVGSKFEQTLTNAVVRFPGMVEASASERLKVTNMLKADALRLGASTEFRPTDIVRAQTRQAMAGFSLEASRATLPLMVDLATASMMDLDRATDIATDALGAFGLLMDDQGNMLSGEQLGNNLKRISNEMSFATNNANLDMEQMFETIKQGAPLLASLGGSSSEFLAIAGWLAGAGIKGTLGGTAMKNIQTNLYAAGGVGARELRRLKINLRDSTGELRPLIDLFEEMREKMDMKGLRKDQRLNIMRNIFGKIPLASAMTLLRTAGDTVRDIQKRIEESTGNDFLAGLSTLQRATTQFKFQEFFSAVAALKIKVFYQMADALTDIVGSMTEWIKANDDILAQDVGEWVADVVKNKDEITANAREWVDWAIAIGGVVLALKGYIMVMTAVESTMVLVGLIGASVLGTLVAIAAAAGVLIALIDKYDIGEKLGNEFWQFGEDLNFLLNNSGKIAAAGGTTFQGRDVVGERNAKIAALEAAGQIGPKGEILASRGGPEMNQQQLKIWLSAEPGTKATVEGDIPDNTTIDSTGEGVTP